MQYEFDSRTKNPVFSRKLLLVILRHAAVPGAMQNTTEKVRAVTLPVVPSSKRENGQIDKITIKNKIIQTCYKISFLRCCVLD